MVLQKYGLTVDAQERDILEVALSDCESADLLIYVPQAVRHLRYDGAEFAGKLRGTGIAAHVHNQSPAKERR